MCPLISSTGELMLIGILAKYDFLETFLLFEEFRVFFFFSVPLERIQEITWCEVRFLVFSMLYLYFLSNDFLSSNNHDDTLLTFIEFLWPHCIFNPHKTLCYKGFYPHFMGK